MRRKRSLNALSRRIFLEKGVLGMMMLKRSNHRRNVVSHGAFFFLFAAVSVSGLRFFGAPASAAVAGLKIGAPEYLYTASGKRVGARPDIDCSFSTWRKDAATMYFYNSWDGGGIFYGPLNDPYQHKAGDSIIDKNGFDGDFWIPNVYRSPDGTMIAFVHREIIPPPEDGCFRIGMALSTDGGARWIYCGDTIKPRVNWSDPKAPDYGNIGGVPYVVRRDPEAGREDFYVYFNEYTGQEKRMCVARAGVADVVAAAKRHAVTPFHKYANGAWTEAGLTGVGTNIIPNGVTSNSQIAAGIYPRDMHADAAFCRPLGKYLITVNGQSESRLYLYASTDGIDWREETLIDSDPSHVTFMPYSTFVSLDQDSSEDCSTVGGDFYILYPRKTMKSWLDQFYRVHCTISRDGRLETATRAPRRSK
jgi:hypothetical protein